MTSLFPPRESLVVTSRQGTGNSRTFFYGVASSIAAEFHIANSCIDNSQEYCCRVSYSQQIQRQQPGVSQQSFIFPTAGKTIARSIAAEFHIAKSCIDNSQEYCCRVLHSKQLQRQQPGQEYCSRVLHSQQLHRQQPGVFQQSFTQPTATQTIARSIAAEFYIASSCIDKSQEYCSRVSYCQELHRQQPGVLLQSFTQQAAAQTIARSIAAEFHIANSYIDNSQEYFSRVLHSQQLHRQQPGVLQQSFTQQAAAKTIARSIAAEFYMASSCKDKSQEYCSRVSNSQQLHRRQPGVLQQSFIQPTAAQTIAGSIESEFHIVKSYIYCSRVSYVQEQLQTAAMSFQRKK